MAADATRAERYDGVAVDATFKNLAGQNLETEHANVMGLVQNGKQAQNGTEQNLTSAPIKPGQTRPVRIDFSHVPQGWNLNAPQLRVVTVTAMGATK